MKDKRKILAERVRQRLEELGKTPREVSIAVTGKPDLIRDIFRAKRLPTGPIFLDLARELETTTEWLLGDAQASEQVQSEVGLVHDRPIPFNHQGKPQEPGIPLLGTGDCAELDVLDTHGREIMVERSSFDPEFHVRYLQRPPSLVGDRTAYAIYFNGSSMEPRFFAGEIGIVQPSRPAGPGDFVVVQLNNGESEDVVCVLVKRLVRRTAQYAELEQYNPPVAFRVDNRRIARMHRIAMPAELLQS